MRNLGLRVRGLGLKIMLCLESYVLQELQKSDFKFPATEPGCILRAQLIYEVIW